MDLRGRRVLVTGASRGIGEGIARAYARAGASVALVARNREMLEGVAREIGGKAYVADLTDASTLRDLITRVEVDGPIDVLVNNAGDERIGPFLEMEADTLDFLVKLNVLAGAELTRRVLPGMVDRGAGHVVNVSSYAGVTCPPHLATYAATKAFVTHHTANLARELRHAPVNFTVVEVGEVADTGLMEKGRTDPALAATFDQLYKLRLSRLVTVDEIADAIVSSTQTGKRAVRLPKRLSWVSALADLPRR